MCVVPVFFTFMMLFLIDDHGVPDEEVFLHPGDRYSMLTKTKNLNPPLKIY